jgi:hypothetical protein
VGKNNEWSEFMILSEGEIQLDSKFGNFLYNICKDEQILTVVEIGTSRGTGSTYCLIQGLLNSNKNNITFLSLECNIELYNKAIQNWKNILPTWANLLFGRIINIDQLDDNNLQGSEKDWFINDVNNLNNCPYILETIPKNIDLLFLDGGEFSTYSEFLILKDRTKYFVLDDAGVRKGLNIKKYIYNNPNEFEVVFDNTDRNGTFFAKRRSII